MLVAVRPSAIAISHRRPEEASPRNVWQAKITGLTLLADRVRLEADGEPPALVDVTAAAVTDLSLAPGSAVWLAVKATDLEVYRRGESGLSSLLCDVADTEMLVLPPAWPRFVVL